MKGLPLRRGAFHVDRAYLRIPSAPTGNPITMNNMNIIWANGDNWESLTEQTVTAQQITIMSENGTVRLIDLTNERQCRIPTFHQMANDHHWQELATIDITPCGAMTFTGRMFGEHWTTRIKLVAAGHHPDLATTPEGKTALAADWESPGHPDEPCVAAYCPHRT